MAAVRTKHRRNQHLARYDLFARLRRLVMQGARWWLVCYDVRDPKRLRKTAKHMEGYGERMQYSVFRCWMTPRQVQELRWELTEILAPEDDVLVIPLCPRCVDGIQCTHTATNRPNWPEKPAGHTIV